VCGAGFQIPGEAKADVFAQELADHVAWHVAEGTILSEQAFNAVVNEPQWQGFQIGIRNGDAMAVLSLSPRKEIETPAIETGAHGMLCMVLETLLLDDGSFVQRGVVMDKKGIWHDAITGGVVECRF